MIFRNLLPGDQFKKTIVDAVNSLIDHCRSTRLVQGPGITLSCSTEGTVISAKPASGGASSGSADRNVMIAKNIGTAVIRAGNPAEIESSVLVDSSGYFQKQLRVRKATSDSELWGVALSDIEPDATGIVQVSGCTYINFNAYSRDFQKYVRPGGSDTAYHFAPDGRATVLDARKYSDSGGSIWVAIDLGGGGASGYDGMFAVKEKTDGTIDINGGDVLCGNSTRYIPGTTLSKPAKPSGWAAQHVLLCWRRAADTNYNDSFFFIIAEYIYSGYTPGEQVCWPIARLSGADPNSYAGDSKFHQLWQSGAIDFGTRYYC